MTNHPSRGWVRRAEAAATQTIAMMPWPPDALVVCFTRAEWETQARKMHLSGYAAGRMDGPRRAAPRKEIA